MNESELQQIIEVLLLSSGEPLTLDKLAAVFDERQKPSIEQIKSALDALIAEYQTRPMELVQVASGYRIQTRAQYGVWIARLNVEKPTKYSRALLETLAIIAYKQPVTRGDIEDIRGVAVNSQIIKTLLEREWIRVAGYKDVAGKPAVYSTTKEFLNYFNLQYLHELPTLSEVMDSLNQHQADLPIEECTE